MRKCFSGIWMAVALVGCSGAAPGTDTTADASAAPADGYERGLPGDGAAPHRGTTSLPKGAWRVQPVDIVDAQGFERPLPAFRVLIPVGWRPQGGVVWNVRSSCAGSDYALQWSITSPDGASVLAMVPQPTWRVVRSYLSFPLPRGPCEGPGWTNVQQYLEGLARQTFPQGRIIDYRARPDLARPLAELLRASPLMQTDLVQARQRAEAGEILVASSIEGRETRDMIRAVVLFTEMRLADVLNPGRIGQETLDGVPTSVVFLRAPAATFDERLPNVIDRSMQRLAEWNNRVFEHNRRKQQAAFDAQVRAGQISYQQLQGMQQAHQQRMQALEAGKQANDRMYEQRNLASDRQQREFVESIRGVETYHEPVAGGVVQLDNSYQHAWRVGDGSYLLTDDPKFRPGLVGLEGEELRRVE